MQARSVVFDLFGDYVRQDGGSISLQKLSAILGSFGVAPDSSRVIMSRVSREGWFDVTRQGRTSTYTPSSKGWELLDTGLERIMEPPLPREWDGIWYTVIFSVPESSRSSRSRLKTALSWLGFGQLASSTWISTRDRLREAEEALKAEPTAHYDMFEARSRGPQSDAARASQCWDLTGLQQDYEAFIERCDTLLNAKPGTYVGEAALVARTELIHDYRKFPFRDPALPAELLPADWPAPRAHQLFLQAFETLRSEALDYFRSVGIS